MFQIKCMHVKLAATLFFLPLMRAEEESTGTKFYWFMRELCFMRGIIKRLQYLTVYIYVGGSEKQLM